MQREADIFSFARCGSPCGYVATMVTQKYVYKTVTGSQILIHKNGYVDSYSSNGKELIGYLVTAGWKGKKWVSKNPEGQELLTKAKEQ